MTHERNVLMWLIGLLIGCGHASPTSPEIHHPNEILAIQYAACHAKYHEIPFTVKVIFEDHIRHDGAQAWGSIMERAIHIVKGPLYTWAPVDIEMVVGHEIAHVMGIWDEDKATAVASRAYYYAGCH